MEDSKFEKLLQEVGKIFIALPIVRTLECPSNNDLYAFCQERGKGPLFEKYMDHITTCRYCGNYLKKEMQRQMNEKN